jgi:2-hydroxy-6-oxonona-2,4-dienedioate hydrolase
VRPPDLAGIRAHVLLIRGRYDRMVPFEVSIAILNHIADSRLVLQVLAFLKGYGEITK